MAGAFADASGTQLNGYSWSPLVTRRNSGSLSYATEGLLSEPQLSNGSISFRMGTAYENEAWSKYEWNTALARIFIGTLGDPFASYKQVFEGSVSGLSRDGVTATLELLGPDALLNKPMLSLEYQGTGGAEGPVAFKGKLKPRAFGYCISVPADDYLVDPAKFIYQVHGYGACSIGAVYEYAQTLGNPVSNVADYAALAALTLLPGQWAKCEAQGMFRLGGRADKKVSADITAGPTTVGTIVPAMIELAGIPSAKIGSFAAFNDKTWSLYQTDQADIGDVARNAVYQAGGVLFADGTGTWQSMDFFAPKAPVVLNADRSTAPLIRSYKLLPVNDPIWKVKIGYDRVWAVHSASDVSPALAELSDANQASADAAQAAQEAAAQAAADSAAAMTRLEAMSDDGKLDRAEKAGIAKDFATEAVQQSGLQNQSTIVDVAAERANLASAFGNLKSYLEGLIPAYTDSTQDTPIDRTVFNTRWKDYWLAKQTLVNKMAGVASAVATWGGVSGPGKPADYATVGAPPGTFVGNKEAAAVVTQLDTNSLNALYASGLSTTNEATLNALKSLQDGSALTLQIKNLTNKVENPDQNVIQTLDMLGAVQPDGNGGLVFVVGQKTALGTPGKLLGQTIDGIQTQVNGHESSITSIKEIVTTPTGSSELRALTTLNSAGVITGTINTLTGGRSRYAVLADEFRIVTNDAAGIAYTPFSVIDGVVTMLDVEITKLRAGSVTITSLAPGLSRSPRFTSGDVMIPSTETTLIETPQFNVGYNDAASGSAASNGSALAMISFTHDGTTQVDTGARMRVYVDTGSGYQLQRTSLSGISTENGNTVWSLKYCEPISITAPGQARVKVTGQGTGMGNSSRNSGTYARSIEINVLSIGR
ncbi:hypothetical protein IFT54_05505 [Sphingomonas sp. CFBP 13714]|uniref:hypothetical protein n=1 Tax=Sphingomonas sp. CFBP 13714 TaxID=2775308 RepID=UPI0017833785|nr:hypothetical protein [Sphingomonas sp. CFBP 13714]MBD8699271.1 hypothetical protein [Sphingomonas sp. CFBP 13714]